MKNKVLSCLLMICLVITMAPSIAWADGGSEASSDAVTLDIADGDITVTEQGYQQGDADLIAWGGGLRTCTDNYGNHDIECGFGQQLR